MAFALKSDGSKRIFCLLWAGTLVIWAIFDWSIGQYVSTTDLSESEYSLAVFICYSTCSLLNLNLLYYLYCHPDTGLRIIAIPIAYYAILSLIVPIEYILFNTEHSYRLFVESSLIANLIEIILLMGADYGIQHSRRLASVGRFIMRPLSALHVHHKPVA